MQEADFFVSRSLTVAEFARQERISKRLAYKLIREGKLPAYRLSKRKLRIDPAEVRAKLGLAIKTACTK